jgi:hypothetical protein
MTFSRGEILDAPDRGFLARDECPGRRAGQETKKYPSEEIERLDLY